jgi:hypothetical protein
MTHRLLTTALCIMAGTMLAGAQVPGLINYQGRLTDANGAPVTGSKNFTISIYDAATGGNLLYTEDIGAVTLDDNGVYSFQFGSAGTSNSQVTENLATTDASTLVYTKALSNSGVVENSLSVTDGTNSWTQSAGNPGVGAAATANTTAGFVIGATITNGGSGYTSPPAVTITGLGSGAAATATLSGGVVTGITITSAGSGYNGGATISIAPPVIPFRVDYSGGSITATYSSAPTSGGAITVTYRYGTDGITGALGAATEQWMTVSVDGTVQGTRQRVLAVPFAERARHADTVSSNKNVIYAINILETPIGTQGNKLLMPFRVVGGAGAIMGVFHIQKTISRINGIECELSAKHFIEGSLPWQTGYRTGSAKISLKAINANGETFEISSKIHLGTTPEGTSLKVQIGPFALNQEEYDYIIEVSTFSIGSLTANSSTEYAKSSNLRLNVSHH